MVVGTGGLGLPLLQRRLEYTQQKVLFLVDDVGHPKVVHAVRGKLTLKLHRLQEIL